MYCAAKFYEILGYDAHYSRIEQFSHMELFSAKKGDTVIIFEEKNSSQQTARKKSQESWNKCNSSILCHLHKISQMTVLYILFTTTCTF